MVQGSKKRSGWVLAGAGVLILAVGCAHLLDQQIREPREEYPTFSLEEQRRAQQRRDERLARERIEDLRETTPAAEWIAMAYHGLLLDANRDVIEMDRQTVERIQESMFEIVMERGGAEALGERGKLLRELFRRSDLAGRDRMVVRSAVICNVLDFVPDRIRNDYLWRHALVNRSVRELVDWSTYTIPSRLDSLLRRLDIRLICLRPPEAEPEYVRRCREEGVPIPPDWPGNEWVRQGELAFTFISDALKTEVFAYHDPAVAGACIALPRRSPATDSIQLLGIICQGAESGKACFWDNISSDGERIRGGDISLDIDKIQNGFNLAETCTNCHRGDNVFVIHPGTALDLGAPYDTDPAVRYEPIGQARWSNPGPLEGLPSPASCTACHGFAEPRDAGGAMQPGYCGILQDAAEQTMPPPGGSSAAGWPAPVGSYFHGHIDFLRKCCTDPGFAC